MSQNNKFTNFRINNEYQNNFPASVGGVPISDIRAVASKMTQASKRLKRNSLTLTDIMVYGSANGLSKQAIQIYLDAMSSEQAGYVVLGNPKKDDGIAVLTYELTPKGENLVGRFLELHADDRDRLVSERMKKGGNHFNKASRRYLRPGNLW